MLRRRLCLCVLSVLLLTFFPHKIVFEKISGSQKLTQSQSFTTDQSGVPVVTTKFFIDGKLSSVIISRKGADYAYHVCLYLY